MMKKKVPRWPFEAGRVGLVRGLVRPTRSVELVIRLAPQDFLQLLGLLVEFLDRLGGFRDLAALVWAD